MFFKTKIDSSLANLSDEDLLKRFQYNEDENCYNELHRRYVHLVYGVCLKYLANKEDSKEMTMHIFERLYSILLHEQIKSFKNWLYVVTRNECHSTLRKDKKRKEQLDVLKQLENSASLFVENVGFLRLLNEGKTQSTNLIEQINLLPKDQRRCIEYFYFEKMSYKEIADETKLSLKQVKSNLQNGKRKLKNRLKMNS